MWQYTLLTLLFKFSVQPSYSHVTDEKTEGLNGLLKVILQKVAEPRFEAIKVTLKSIQSVIKLELRSSLYSCVLRR